MEVNEAERNRVHIHVSVARDGVEIVGFGESRGGVDMGGAVCTDSQLEAGQRNANPL